MEFEKAVEIARLIGRYRVLENNVSELNRVLNKATPLCINAIQPEELFFVDEGGKLALIDCYKKEMAEIEKKIEGVRNESTD